ncbi:hypothetical protein WN51_11654 [Melipona quadrifasciata]|uniref:Uncharacterized protein n=1 Tax=Melipona quadrifasciata TaxID=166423 RepID=A0A0M9A5F8_9HYME|nr:hypothetical protein WN51_11654 [Melipona quadrifasciata]
MESEVPIVRQQRDSNSSGLFRDSEARNNDLGNGFRCSDRTPLHLNALDIEIKAEDLVKSTRCNKRPSKVTRRPGFLSKKFLPLPDACAEHLSEPLPAAGAFKLDFPGELFTCLLVKAGTPLIQHKDTDVIDAFNARHKTGFSPFHSHGAWSPEELLCPINPLRTVRFPGIATSDVAIVFAVMNTLMTVCSGKHIA